MVGRAVALLVLLACGLLALANVAHAEIVTGKVTSSKEGFAFLGKFCFDYHACPTCSQIEKEQTAPGGYSVEMSITGLPASSAPKLLLYDDSDNAWPQVFDHPTDTCENKRSHANNWRADFDPRFNVEFKDGKWVFPLGLITQGLRPRFWFVALADCEAKSLPEIEYSIHFKNLRAQSWDVELGVNVQGLNIVYLAFFLIFTIFLIVQIYSAVLLSRKISFVHPLIRLFLFCITLEYLSVSLNMVHMVRFAANGKGIILFDRVGDILEVTARIFFLLLLMLLAKGWTISGNELTDGKKLIGSAVLFAVSYVCILVWKYMAEDPAETSVSTVSQIMQVTMAAIWMGFAVWFMMTIYASYKKEDNPVKKTLFGRLALLYSVWFLALPFVVFLSFAFRPWVREKAVASLQLSFSFFAYAAMGFLTWHSRADEYFNIATRAPDVKQGGINYEQL